MNLFYKVKLDKGQPFKQNQYIRWNFRKFQKLRNTDIIFEETYIDPLILFSICRALLTILLNKVDFVIHYCYTFSYYYFNHIFFAHLFGLFYIAAIILIGHYSNTN